MTDFLGMHWTMALTIISIVLMIVDLFIFQGGGLTFISDIFFPPVKLSLSVFLYAIFFPP